METERVNEGPAPGGLTARIILTVLGAASMILGAFLSWLNFGALGDLAEQLGQELPPTAGVNLEYSIFFSVEAGQDQASFFTSAGLIVIVLGALALLGLALRSGTLTRIAGALAVIAFILYVITLYRAPSEAGFDVGIGNVGIGMWLVLLGGILTLVGGFLEGRRVTVSRSAEPGPPPA